MTIAIVDDAFNIDHPNLQAFIFKNPDDAIDNDFDDDDNGYSDDYNGWDAADNDPDVRSPTERIDEFFHGTHLAGIVVQVVRTVLNEDASRYIKIVPVKSISDSAALTQLENAYDGFKYALDINADIILTAWNVATLSPNEKLLLEQADKQGTIVIASAGNERVEKILYPAAHSTVVAVAATDQNNSPFKISNHGGHVDLSAPGKEITSNGYAATATLVKSGSSMSAAMVAATAALVKLFNPDLSRHEIKACLVNHTQNLEIRNQAKHGKYGSGVLDVSAAIKCQSIRNESNTESILSRSTGYIVLDPTMADVVQHIDPMGQFKGIRFTHLTDQEEGEFGTLQLEDTPNRSGKSRILSLTRSQQSISVPAEFTYLRYSDTQPAAEKTLLHYETISIDFSKAFCTGTVLVDSERVIEDGSGVSPYAHNSVCKWQVVAPPDKLIEFKVLELNTEPNRDKIHFFSGTKTNEPLFAELSGTGNPPPFRSWHNKALLWFLSDGEKQFQGFKIEVTFVDKPGQ